MGMEIDLDDARGQLARFVPRRRSALVASVVVLVAVLAVFEVQRADDLAWRNEATAQLQSDQFATFYASTVAGQLEAGPRTNAQLEPDAVERASGASNFYSEDVFTPGFSGSAVLVERQALSWPADSITIRIDRTYPEAFGATGTIETCYAVNVPLGPKPSAPVTTIMDTCSTEPMTPDPSATS
jgi:hypothetical protein